MELRVIRKNAVFYQVISDFLRKNKVSQTILTLSPENLISWSILQHLVILMGRVRPLQEAPVDKSKI